MSDSVLKPFNFSPEIIARMRDTQEIPVNFYNANGQVLIPRKEQASGDMINKLLQHIGSGIYYREDDEDKLGLRKNANPELEGLTDTKLLTEKRVAEITEATESLFNELKFAAFGAVHSQKMHSQVTSFITDFEQQPDMMVGVINILETVKAGSAGSSDLSKQAVKRAVVAMALKSRSMKAMISKDRGRGSEAVQPVMMGGMLAQIGKTKMNLPEGDKLTQQQRAYVRKYPLLSYLMVAHEPTVAFEVKRLILNQRRTLPENSVTNNYPEFRWMTATLQSLVQENDKKGKKEVASDILRQLASLKEFVVRDQVGVNIAMGLAPEFGLVVDRQERQRVRGHSRKLGGDALNPFALVHRVGRIPGPGPRPRRHAGVGHVVRHPLAARRKAVALVRPVRIGRLLGTVFRNGVAVRRRVLRHPGQRGNGKQRHGSCLGVAGDERDGRAVAAVPIEVLEIPVEVTVPRAGLPVVARAVIAAPAVHRDARARDVARIRGEGHENCAVTPFRTAS